MRLNRIPKTTLLVLATVSLSCTDSTGPATGSLDVTISTASAVIDVDPDGYSLRVDAEAGRSIPATSAALHLDLPPGNHAVRLEGLAPNCSITGPTELSVEVISGRTTFVAFGVTCVANTGTIRVTTSTSGAGASDSGYIMVLPGVGPVELPANGTLAFASVRAGQIPVTLDNVSRNCVVEGPNPRTVNVAFNGTAEVAFTIRCVPPGGLQISVATSGVDLDPDGYNLEIRLQGAPSSKMLQLPANGMQSVSRLLPGTYTLTLSGIAANCTAAITNPRMAIVSEGADTPVTLEVTCAAPTKIAYVVGTNANEEIYLINPDGTGSIRLTTLRGSDKDPAWSPDGKRIAFASHRDGNSEIYVMNADGTNQVRVTDVAAADYLPAWSPDGARIAFVSERDGNAEIYVMNADGTSPRRLTNDRRTDSAPDWSPDGSRIAFHVDTGGFDFSNGIWIMNADGSNARQVTASPRGAWQPAWSPDGKQIAFAETSYYTMNLAVVNVDGTGATQLTSGLDVVADPTWSPDGRKIAFAAAVGGCYSFYESLTCAPYIQIIGTDRIVYAFSRSTLGFNPDWQR